MNKKVFDRGYFNNRFLNDNKRVKAFNSESKFIKNHVSSGRLLDIGCSTGEMIEAFDWDGPCYGMEISRYAKTKAKKNGIKFTKDIFNSRNYFDLVTYRGTIQHIDTPFLYLKKTYTSLKKGGKVAFLATPNSSSIYFKLWNTLPFLDLPTTNYYIPSDKWLINAMENIGFKLVEKRYPYIKSPYSNPLLDHIKFLLKILGMNTKFPFWKNSMDLIFEKQ